MTSLLRARQGTASPILTIDLDAIAANTRLFAARARGVLMAVVKADGYGHGAVEVAATALENGASAVGVATIDEALALRRAGITAPILSWLNHPLDADYDAAIAAGIDVAVASTDQLETVVGARGLARVHLSLDTGMAREGADPTEWADLCERARSAELRDQILVVGLMGHLAAADDALAESNRLGRLLIDWGSDVARLNGLRPASRHLAATSATLNLPDTHYTMSRVGAGLVGIDPSRSTRLAAAMTLTAPLVGVRMARAGTAVGYGHEWISPRRTRLGLVGIGYADGVPRSASGIAEVLVRDYRRPVVGRVSMDQLVIDLGDGGGEIGETVTIVGSGDLGAPSIAEWADWAGTIPQEIVTGIGARVARVVVGGSSANGVDR